MINETELKFMKQAVELSKKCPFVQDRYNVGAVIVTKDDEVISTGYSREATDNIHAEEMAIKKAIKEGVDLKETTLYSTMEPCGLRLSGNQCCADWIIEYGIKRVIFGINEPPFLVQNCTGAQKLKDNGLIVEQCSDYDEEIHALNSHMR